MIKFFRRIRQQLLTKNKFSKYLLYVIGEIVLVMVGILLALQVNNWNEQRKSNLQEKALLEELQKNLQSNLDILDGYIAIHEERQLQLSAIINHFDSFDFDSFGAPFFFFRFASSIQVNAPRPV